MLPSEVEASISYVTVPSNETPYKNAEIGNFLVPDDPRLRISTELKSMREGAGSLGKPEAIPAGEHTIGTLKNSSDDWTLAIYPGTPTTGAAPGMSKLIKLISDYSRSDGRKDHLLIDIVPGDDELDGKAVLTIRFGTMYL